MSKSAKPTEIDGEEEDRELDPVERRLLMIRCVNWIVAIIGLGLLLIWLAYRMNWDADLAPDPESAPSDRQSDDARRA